MPIPSNFRGVWCCSPSRMIVGSFLPAGSVAGELEHPPVHRSPYLQTDSGSRLVAALLSSGQAYLVPAVETAHPGADSWRCCPTATTDCRLLLAEKSYHRISSQPATEHRQAPRAVVPSGRAAAIRGRNGPSRCSMRAERGTHVCHLRCPRQLRLRAACFAGWKCDWS